MPEYSYIVCHEQLTQLVGGFFECVPIVTCSIQTNESSGCIFCVNDVEQACFDEFHQWHPARLSSGIVTIHYFQKCFIRCRELAYIQFYKARNAGFILIVTCAGLFCTDAFVKTDNRNQYSSVPEHTLYPQLVRQVIINAHRFNFGPYIIQNRVGLTYHYFIIA